MQTSNSYYTTSHYYPITVSERLRNFADSYLYNDPQLCGDYPDWMGRRILEEKVRVPIRNFYLDFAKYYENNGFSFN